MQVNRPSNIPGYGQGAGATERSNRDGQRKRGDQDEPKKHPEAADEVELHTPEDGEAPPVAKPVSPAARPPDPKGDQQPPLDLSA